MPIYEYTCSSCNAEFELLLRGSEQPSCPSCGKRKLEKKFSVPAAHTTSSAESACPARQMGACGGGDCGGGGCDLSQLM
jgi:putative FmdB family regulatory protein